MGKKNFTKKEIKKIIEKNYSIGIVKEIHSILEGASSECFHIVTRAGEYLFKDIEMTFMNHPDKEPLVNDLLSKNGIPVSEFYKTRKGKYLLKYSGHIFHLQSFIKGKILELNTAPEWLMKESAEMLGKIHNALDGSISLYYGIGHFIFELFTPEAAKVSYEKSLDIALKQGDKQNIIDLEYRISLLDKIKDIKLEMDRFTYKNTHGDYFISQIICGEKCINGIIDFTSACIHPACWELIRSYSLSDPECVHGKIDYHNLVKYIRDYMKYSKLSTHDLKMMAYLYYYQLAVCDYFSQYYKSDNSNKKVLCHYAHWSTMLCRWFEENIEELTDKLEKEFC